MSRYRPLSAIRRLVIHSSGSPNGQPLTAADIDAWHEKRQIRRSHEARYGLGRWEGRGPHAHALRAIGYHFVIRVNGVVEVGRRLTEEGGNGVGGTHRGIGVCLIGTDRFSEAQWAVLRRHVVTTNEWVEREHFEPLSIVGHRDLAPDVRCPGFDVAAWLDGGMVPPQTHILEVAA